MQIKGLNGFDMKKIILISIILFSSVNASSFWKEDTLKGHINGTFTEIGPGHKLFVGKGNIIKFGSFTVEMDYSFEYITQYSGKATPGSVTIFKFNEKSELHTEILGGNWYVDFVTDPPEVIFDLSAKITGGKGKFKAANGILYGTGTQLYIPSTPTTFDFTAMINY